MSTDREGSYLTVQTVIGCLAIVYGAVLTASNFGWIHDVHLFRYWPLGIVAVGIVMFSRAADATARSSAGVVIAFGVWLLAANLFGWHVTIAMLWPLALIAVGVAMVIRARTGPTDPAAGTEQRFSDFAFWSGAKRRVTTPVFRGADLTAVMGGIELDLRSAGTGGDAIIDVFIMMGGLEIRVPPDWAVSNRIVAIMAGVEDRTTGTPDAKNRLILRGFVMMGGVEVKS